MSSLNPGFSSKNTLDAGASSAMKSTDQTDGVFEDASSDIKSKQQGSVLGGGLQGGFLDQVGGSTGAVGYDAKHGSSLSATAGDKAGNAYDEAKKGSQSAAASASQSAQGLSSTIGQYAEDAKNEASKLGSKAQNEAGLLGNNAKNAANDSTSGAHSGGGLLHTIQDKVSGVFGTQHSQQTQQESAFAAGASSATKNTDLTDGIHEDAGKGIESVFGATARKH
ncbi:hypothetical protein H2200_010700 [Cladophialophora chaetospira]|uniref:Uncharacterized protein n=1 Tax=Cladophialophora chaetospira TaxID=386627 RepID=A0AA38X0L0_9EURO|nr:hypothetical protein H2200_010700 [Cladophialophora chaetospira]